MYGKPCDYVGREIRVGFSKKSLKIEKRITGPELARAPVGPILPEFGAETCK